MDALVSLFLHYVDPLSISFCLPALTLICRTLLLDADTSFVSSSLRVLGGAWGDDDVSPDGLLGVSTAVLRLNKDFLLFSGSLHQASSPLGSFHITLSTACLLSPCCSLSICSRLKWHEVQQKEKKKGKKNKNLQKKQPLTG